MEGESNFCIIIQEKLHFLHMISTFSYLVNHPLQLSVSTNNHKLLVLPNSYHPKPYVVLHDLHNNTPLTLSFFLPEQAMIQESKRI
jgi:hypothetical protein